LQHVSVLLLCATWHLVASRSLQRAAVARAGASGTCTVDSTRLVFLVHLAQTEHFCIFLENARTLNTLHPDASLRLLWYDGAGRMRGPSVYESLQHVSVLLLCATWHLVASRSLQRAAVARAGALDTCTVE
jgi:hypothetical protein